jgi:mannose-6-phosphate isomerase-like protein (cupin superfamily)
MGEPLTGPAGVSADVAETVRAARAGGPLYREILRVPALSAGVYRLAAGAADPQSPHGEDEVYYVLAGSARLRVGDEDHEAVAGRLLYVSAGVEHRFHDITDDLELLVVFAPAEGGAEAAAGRPPPVE